MDEALSLSAPAPNPASGQARVQFAVQESAETTIAVYNVLGQRVKTLYEGTPQAEQAETLALDASTLSSGTYFVRMQVEGKTVSQRLTVVK
jgi:hypothetical protein